MTQLADYEVEAWKEYEAMLTKYNETHSVKSYDRVSIHDNFPEIKAAFEKAVSMRTFRLLEND